MKKAKITKYVLLAGATYYFIGAIVHFFGLTLFPWYDGALFSLYHDTVITLCALIFGSVLIIVASDVRKYKTFITLIIWAGIVAIIFSLYIIFFIDLNGTTKLAQTIVEMILLIIYAGSLLYLRRGLDSQKNIKNNLIIELHVPDLEVVKNFYSKLDFKIGLEDKLNDKNLGHLTMTRKDDLGTTILNFYGGDERIYNQAFFGKFPKDTKRGYETEITIPVCDIGNLYKDASDKLNNNIVRSLEKLEDHGHKWQDFRMVDPFGFYLRFTELIDWGQK